MILTSDQIGKIEQLVDRLKKWLKGEVPHAIKDYGRYVQLIRFVEPKANIALMALSTEMPDIVRVVHVRFQELLKTFEGNDRSKPINAIVGFEKENCLDRHLAATEIPTNFDLLSIDIDGNDYHVWECLQKYKPKVVVIEYNPTIPNTVEFVQPRDMSITQGSSILSMTKLAGSKRYELVAVTHANAIFVDSKYFDSFGISDNSVDVMRTDTSLITHIFSGFDGTVFIRGYGRLPWQDISYKESRVQQLPKWARKRVGDRNIFRKKLGKIFRRLRKKNII